MSRLVKLLLIFLAFSSCQHDIIPPDAAPPDASQPRTGSSCQLDEECSGNFCIMEFPDGYCSAVCSLQDDCVAGRELCVGQEGMPDFGFCYLLCQEDAECRVGYSCQQLSQAFLEKGCLPAEET